MKRRRTQHPIVQLALAMRVAALNIAHKNFRNMAVRAAENIPRCNMERGGGRKGELARLGRSVLATLNTITPDQHADKADVLRGCADAIMSDFRETSFVELGKRPRSAA